MTRNSPEDVEFLILECLDQADGPLGCGAVADYLRRHGHPVSEATAGRLLRDLDLRGYTTRAGFRGRSLTEVGVARLGSLRHNRTLSTYGSELFEALSARRVDEVVDILVARRAIERETARLAAERARPEDVAALELILEQYEKADSASAMARADMTFHQKLAEISGNRVLEAATRLVHGEVSTTPLPPSVSLRMHRRLAEEHRRILESIRTRDPEGAERAMVHHIEGIIEAVRQHAVTH